MDDCCMLKKKKVIKDLFSLSFSYLGSLYIWLTILWREFLTHMKDPTKVTKRKSFLIFFQHLPFHSFYFLLFLVYFHCLHFWFSNVNTRLWNKHSFYIPVVNKCSLLTSIYFIFFFFNRAVLGTEYVKTVILVFQAFLYSSYSCEFCMHTIKKHFFVMFTVTPFFNLWHGECLNHDSFVILLSPLLWKSLTPTLFRY